MTELDFDSGNEDQHGIVWRVASNEAATDLLSREHYLGPLGRFSGIFGGYRAGELVAVQVWKKPTARNLPNGGEWLELARWCLTRDAGPDAGSRMHRQAALWAKATFPEVFPLRRDPKRADLLRVTDRAAVRSYLASEEWRDTTSRWPMAVPLMEVDR